MVVDSKSRRHEARACRRRVTHAAEAVNPGIPRGALVVLHVTKTWYWVLAGGAVGRQSKEMASEPSLSGPNVSTPINGTGAIGRPVEPDRRDAREALGEGERRDVSSAADAVSERIGDAVSDRESVDVERVVGEIAVLPRSMFLQPPERSIRTTNVQPTA